MEDEPSRPNLNPGWAISAHQRKAPTTCPINCAQRHLDAGHRLHGGLHALRGMCGRLRHRHPSLPRLVKATPGQHKPLAFCFTLQESHILLHHPLRFTRELSLKVQSRLHNVAPIQCGRTGCLRAHRNAKRKTCPSPIHKRIITSRTLVECIPVKQCRSA